MHAVGQHMFSRTGQQLFCLDSDHGDPFLVVLADPCECSPSLIMTVRPRSKRRADHRSRVPWLCRRPVVCASSPVSCVKCHAHHIPDDIIHQFMADRSTHILQGTGAV